MKSIRLHPKAGTHKLALAVKSKLAGAVLDREEKEQQQKEEQMKETTTKLIETREDPDAEAIIAKLGLKFTLKTVRYSEIDIAGGAQNMARVTQDRMGKAIDPEVVTRYSGSMLGGDIFPRPVLVARLNKSYLPAGGNHRLDAWREAYGSDFSIESYIVDGKDNRSTDMLPRLLNLRHGLPTSHQQALDAAVIAVKEHGYKINAAEKLCSLRPGSLATYITMLDTRKEISNLGVNSSLIPASTISTLSPLRRNTNVLQHASRLIVDARLKKDDVANFVRDIRKETTEGSQMGVVGKYQKMLAERLSNGPQAPSVRPARVKFLMALSSLESTTDGKSKFSQFQITDANEQKEIADRIKSIIRVLGKIAQSGKVA